MQKNKASDDVKKKLKEIWKLLHDDAEKFAEGEKKFNQLINKSSMKKYLKSHPTDVLIIEHIKKKIQSGSFFSPQNDDSEIENKYGTRTDGLSTFVAISTITENHSPVLKESNSQQKGMEQWEVNVSNMLIGQANDINQHKKRAPIENVKNIFDAPPDNISKSRPAKKSANQRSENYKALDRNDSYVRVCSLLDFQMRKCDELINLNKNSQNNKSNELRECKKKLDQIFSQVELLHKQKPTNDDQLKILLNNSRPIMDKIKNIEMTIKTELKSKIEVIHKPPQMN